MNQYDSGTLFRLSADGTNKSVIEGHSFQIKSPLAFAVNSDHLIVNTRRRDA